MQQLNVTRRACDARSGGIAASNDTAELWDATLKRATNYAPWLVDGLKLIDIESTCAFFDKAEGGNMCQPPAGSDLDALAGKILVLIRSKANGLALCPVGDAATQTGTLRSLARFVTAAEPHARAPKAKKEEAERLKKEAERLKKEKGKQGWQPLAPLMRAARVWADHYYRCADQLVGISVICSLWVLTVLPLNYVQSVLLFKRNFYRVIARRTRKADLLEKLIH